MSRFLLLPGVGGFWVLELLLEVPGVLRVEGSKWDEVVPVADGKIGFPSGTSVGILARRAKMVRSLGSGIIAGLETSELVDAAAPSVRLARDGEGDMTAAVVRHRTGEPASMPGLNSVELVE